eukprot:Plantae.Rhodophyta-Palmaria_palmata.ctg1000.p2 GENE.Plantae.Rhodophyta-Palmaria_palmata.ctg1000~~Plantae.Rhodophyta-Palmaria_palmata.ctg1000.p2  ORF type:complete len:438 (-),score=60.44 Plantae.Rhodophyta-Palmaria_palmata.ctg1000:355-1668(-)
MSDEIETLKNRETWKLVPRSGVPPGKKVLLSDFHLKMKNLKDGSIDINKARFCAGGHKQIYGSDYDLTYAPVIGFDIVRLLLSVASKENMTVEHVDMKGAILCSDVDTEIFMEQPNGFKEGTDKKDLVCQLLKSLYGIKQGSKLFHVTISEDLIAVGFENMSSSPCLFVHRLKGIILVIYVDDGLIPCKNKDRIEYAKKELRSVYELKKLGEASRFLGVGIKHSKDGTAITQRSFIEETLEDFGMSDCRPAVTPTEMCAVSSLASKEKCSEENQKETAKLPYRLAVGKLLCISSKTGPDICVAVNLAARRVADLREDDWNRVLRILRYLKGTKDLALVFGRDGPVKLETYADADFASTADRRSVSGITLKIKGSAVFNYSCNKQTCAALSTGDDELMSQSQEARETVYARNVLEFMGCPQTTATILFQDNSSAIIWA